MKASKPCWYPHKAYSMELYCVCLHLLKATHLYLMGMVFVTLYLQNNADAFTLRYGIPQLP